MDTNCDYIAYESTGYFSKLVIDYLQHNEKLQPFYIHPVSLDGIKASIEARKKFDTPRSLLVTELQKQYAPLGLSSLQQENIEKLKLQNTFTITTAHQPNIFTGPLYFIYKILHTIKLANDLKKLLPENNYVPFYYMGSEDADLDELGHLYIKGEKLTWQTKQTGAVGRMKVDKNLLTLIDRMAGELEVEKFGKELIQLLRTSYTLNATIQNATLQLVNELFKDYGLLVLIPDNAALKKPFNDVVKKELLQQFSHPIVQETCKKISEYYKAQASGRDINLFYLLDDARERLYKDGHVYKAEGLGLCWTEQEILTELEEHPERFSANVILRGVFQETVLPNIAFIGGGGEVAYWLELKNVFEAAGVPYPVIMLRNSFIVVEEEQKTQAAKLRFTITDLFKPTDQLINELVIRESDLQLTLQNEKQQLQDYYKHLKDLSDKIDSTLSEHIEALQVKALHKINVLEKKMLRAEKRKFDAQQRQIEKLKNQLFPNNSLQERVENFSTYYARYGKEWIQKIYEASLSLESKFTILEIENFN